MEGLFIILFLGLFVGIMILNHYMTAKRRQEVSEWARSRGLRFSPEKERGLDRRFEEFRCLKQGSNRYAYNICSGDWSGRHIKAFDYHYETHSTDSKGRSQTHHHQFSAVILESYLPLKALFIRPEGFFDKVTEFFGMDDIDFESAEFSRKFYVKAQDRKWAFDVLHARTMQFLLDSPRFTIEFGPYHVIASRSSTFSPSEFEAATGVIHGILDAFPDYLVRSLKEEGVLRA